MNNFFKRELDPNELTEVKKFYTSLENVTIEQYPLWNQVEQKKDLSFFFAKKNGQIVCFSIISEKKYPLLKIAQIHFGPLFKNADDLIDALTEIRKYYQEAGYAYLSIQLAIPTGSTSDYVEYKLNQKFKIHYEFDRHNWSSLIVDLSPSVDQIYRGFSKGHKSAIKSSVSQGITARAITTNEELDMLADIYYRMSVARSLSADLRQTKDLFTAIFNFFNEEKLGVFLGVFDQNNSMLGGVALLFQGKTVRYYKGASDPERKDVSVLHVAIYEGIKLSKELEYKTFDLWGYNHMVDDQDQIFFINRFKKGFSDNFLFYPKKMHISLKKGGYYVYKKLMENEKKLNFLKVFKRK